MQPITLKQIADFAGGILVQGEASREINGISTDSRSTREGELFLALRGDKFDGHNFVSDHAAKGGRGAVVARGFVPANLPEDYALVEVEETLPAYQRIAAAYRRTLSAKVVAITGSNGKTSTKDFTAAILARKYRVLKTEGNLNNHIGVPKTLLRASADDEVIVLEMGMNHPGEIAPLAEMAHPDVAIITNIGTAHIEFLGSRAGIAQEKGTLAAAVEASGHVVLLSADDFSSAIAERVRGTVVLVGGADAELRAEGIEEDLAGSRFTLIAGDERLRATLPISGWHMVGNALLAVATGRILDVPLADCLSALAGVRITKGRMEWKNVGGLRILDDSYNANPDSMVAALETLAQMPTSGRRFAVLGKMGELGSAAAAGYRRVGEAAAALRIDLVGTGPETQAMLEAARGAGLEALFPAADADEAARVVADRASEGDLVLIKGSRSAAMERMLPLLEQLLGSSDPKLDRSTTVSLSRVP